jgi:non-specific serine/threonine protein kinase/serine/threonine-protein kinase
MASEDFPNNRETNEDELATSVPEPSEAQPGTVIGPYHLLQLIGEGGMGQVWLAEQREPVRRGVALKLIKAGMDTREVVARFQSERQALALMDHPAIAKVFDAGSTPQGRPYFVMEFVPGLPITTYADKHKLTTRQRLELFMLVCDGVQHAHQKTIIHRDLKPSNILVSEMDGKPVPRIIDFGVAKATSQRLTANSVYTQLGALIGTLGYMSPEQADSGGENIDTRSDVYSLGVVLYELLVGALPLDFHKVAYNEFLRVLREEEPQRPSTRLRTMGGESVTSAKNRGADPATLTRQLRGDPDAITLKALEKDRKRRYGSPSELAADIARCLRNEPVVAHPPSVAYRTGKYIRRHWLGVSMASAVLLLLVGFAIAQTIALRRITQERDRADRITEFMTSMFKVSDPSEARGNSVTAREILDKASNDIQAGMSKDPELQAKMMYTMAVTYRSLGLNSQAEPLLEHALEIQRRILGPRSPDTLRTMSNLAMVIVAQGRLAEGEKLARENLDLQRSVLGTDNRDTVATMRCLAASLQIQGRFVESEKLSRDSIEIQRRVFGPNDQGTLYAMTALSSILEAELRYPEAEKLLKEDLDIQRRVLGPDHPDTLRSMFSLSNALSSQGKYSEAEKLERETLEIQRRVLGPDHPTTLSEMDFLATTLEEEGRLPEAEKVAREELADHRRVSGLDSTDTSFSMTTLASILAKEEKFGEAEKIERASLDIDRRILGPDIPDTLESQESLAIDLCYERRYTEAESLFRDAIQRAGKANLAPATSEAWYNFAVGTAVAGRRKEALEYLGRAIDIMPIEADAAASDPDLKSLHGDPRFEALIAKARQPAPATTH